MKLLILSCRCSGTQFTAKLLRKANLDFGHEIIRKNGVIGWSCVGQEDAFFKDFDYILHQVRNPRDVIRTLPPRNDFSWNYVKKILGKNIPKNELERNLWFWTEWNKLCESRAQLTYRVEDLPTMELENINTKRKRLPRLSWNEIKNIYLPAYLLAEKYGYINPK